MDSLDQWILQQHRRAVAGMLMSISPVEIVKSRPGFGQTVRPRKGAIVASPVLAAYDPDPDYFFHWYRDSAVVIDALRLLFDDGSVGPEALVHLADFVRFSVSLQALDGRALVAAPSWRARVSADFTQYLRSDSDLVGVHGEAVAAETRVNPDGTLDISRWTRPQHDGAPLRALALLRWLRNAKAAPALEGRLGDEIAGLVRSDLAFTLARWRTPSYDIWEEETGLHYYTLRMAGAALEEGAAWLRSLGDARQAQPLLDEAQFIACTLDDYWLADAGHYRSRVLADGTRSAKELDIAVILATIHAATDTATNVPADAAAADVAGGPAHCAGDPRMHATLARLEAVFDAEYPINHQRGSRMAPAMGRYAGDIYYSGGAYYFSTLGAAEFCYRAARLCRDSPSWFQRGDAFLETVRAYTPPNGDLSEQFDRQTGAQTSARHLAWSYAAFLSCVAVRRGAVAAS